MLLVKAEAEAKRKAAVRARRIAPWMPDLATREQVLKHAAELDAQADDLERQRAKPSPEPGL